MAHLVPCSGVEEVSVAARLVRCTNATFSARMYVTLAKTSATSMAIQSATEKGFNGLEKAHFTSGSDAPAKVVTNTCIIYPPDIICIYAPPLPTNSVQFSNSAQ